MVWFLVMREVLVYERGRLEELESGNAKGRNIEQRR